VKVFDKFGAFGNQGEAEDGFGGAGGSDDDGLVDDGRVDFMREIEGFVEGRDLGKGDKDFVEVVFET